MALKATKSLTKATELLMLAGADTHAFGTFLNTLRPSEQANITDLIVNNDKLVTFWARRFPSSGSSLYQDAETSFGFAQTLAQRKADINVKLPLIGNATGHAIPNTAVGGGEVGVLKGEAEGMKAKRLENGVIVAWDPNDSTATTEVYFPNDKKAQIQGSRQWLKKVEEKWDDETVEKWRQKLAGLGYSVPDEGGWDSEFAQTLATAYKQFYADGQKWKQQTQVSGGGVGARPDIKLEDLYDPAQARQAVRAKFQQVFGEDPTNKELEEWTGVVEQTARKMARHDKGSTTSLSARFEEKFEKDPVAREFIDQANELEQNTGLADGILSIAQISAR